MLTRRSVIVSTLPLWVARGDDWSEYLRWLKGKPAGDLVGLDSYRKELLSRGIAAEEVDRRMQWIAARAMRRPEAMRLWFNSMYGPEGGAKGPDWPTPLLIDAARDLKPGTALDVSMGEGRNSIYLARLGWRVTGFDVSDVAVAHAQERATRERLRINAVRAGYQDFHFGRNRWGLITMTYAYFPIRDSRAVQKLIESIRRGGTLVFQHGVLEHAGEDAALLGIPQQGELKRIFAALEITRYEEVEELTDWQTGAGGRKGHSVKMIARRR